MSGVDNGYSGVNNNEALFRILREESNWEKILKERQKYTYPWENQ